MFNKNSTVYILCILAAAILIPFFLFFLYTRVIIWLSLARDFSPPLLPLILMLDVVCSTDVVFRSAFSAVWISMDVFFKILCQRSSSASMTMFNVFNHSQTILELHVSQCYLYFSVFVRSTASGNSCSY